MVEAGGNAGPPRYAVRPAAPEEFDRVVSIVNESFEAAYAHVRPVDGPGRTSLEKVVGGLHTGESEVLVSNSETAVLLHPFLSLVGLSIGRSRSVAQIKQHRRYGHRCWCVWWTARSAGR